MIERLRDSLATVIFTVAVVVLTITFSIGLPIYARNVYYAHLPSIQQNVYEWTDVWVEEDVIVEAYDEILDFLTLPGREFGSGRLPYSEEGKGHFEDCKILFDLNRNAFLISLGVVIFLLIWDRCDIIHLVKFRGLSPTYWAGVGTLATFATLAVVVAPNFEKAFEIFHKMFFPGKDNWMFNPYNDPIILFMPMNFFMNCAVLICLSILTISLVHILVGYAKRDKFYWFDK